MRISESIQIDQALAPASLATAKTTSYYSMANYRTALVLVTTTEVKSGDSVSVQLVQAKTSVGGSSKNLGDAIIVEATEDGPLTIVAETSEMKLDADEFTYIAATITATVAGEDEVTASALLLRGDGRYGVGAQ